MLQEKINFVEAKNKALEFVRKNGPSMPSQVAKEINIPPLFASALLSQLISEKSLKASNLKIGGSPLYYIEDQKEKLLDFINHLPTVEMDVCKKLQREGVIVDENVMLVEKVALRNIKDFSVPLTVRVGESKKIFWKWFSLPQEDTLQRIGNLIKIYGKGRVGEVKVEKKVETEEKVEIKEDKKVIVKPPTPKPDRQDIQIDFQQKVKEFLAANKVKIIEEKVVRKNREMEFTLHLNSSLGKITFFAIAKNKKIITPADVTLMHYKGQEKKLPLIFLSSGKFTKKAEEKAGELGITLKSLEEKI